MCLVITNLLYYLNIGVEAVTVVFGVGGSEAIIYYTTSRAHLAIKGQLIGRDGTGHYGELDI